MSVSSDELEIDLSPYSDRGFKNGDSISLSHKPNFIFGKNGTGKTTITDAIYNQCSEKYDVRIFKDFDGVADNNILNAISLGTENANIQIQINAINLEISNKEKDILPPNEPDATNLFTEYNKNLSAYKKSNDNLQKFLTKSATSITNTCGLGRNYNKNKFSEDIEKSPLLLSNDESNKYSNILKDDLKESLDLLNFQKIDCNTLLSSVNQLLLKSIIVKDAIAELDGSKEKQNFAKEGIKIHHPGDRCAFCGSIITDDRWDKLNRYFNDKTSTFEKEIENLISTLKNNLSFINGLVFPQKDSFYSPFLNDIEILLTKSKALKAQYDIFIQKLITALSEKKKEMFTVSRPLDIDLPDELNDLEKDFNEFIKKNNSFGRNIAHNQQEAANKLRLNEVAKIINGKEYKNIITKHQTASANYKVAENEFNSAKREIENLKESRKKLALETKDESKAATQINQLLHSIGTNSFSIEPIKGQDGERGQYKVRGFDGTIRDVTALSKGEKKYSCFIVFHLKSR